MLDRREFIKLLLEGIVAGDLLGFVVPRIKPAVAAGEVQKVPVVMLETGSCTGDSVSLWHSWNPDFRYIISNVLDWRYDTTIMQTGGSKAFDLLMDTYEKDADQYILIVQGSMIQRDNGNYDLIAYNEDESKYLNGLELVKLIASKAKYIVAIGTCATHGGPPSGHPNPSQAVGLQKILTDRKVINVTGCPAHADWTMGTLLHLALYGEPELDSFNRPKMFYGITIHDRCERRHFFDQGIFATDLGQKECLYRVGCKGPVTFADCPVRHWHDRRNWPVSVNSPCIGCTEPGFPDLMSPFTAHLPDIPFPGGTMVNTGIIGLTIFGTTSLAILAHLFLAFYNGRYQRNVLQSTTKGPHRYPVKRTSAFHQYRLKSYIPGKNTFNDSNQIKIESDKPAN